MENPTTPTTPAASLTKVRFCQQFQRSLNSCLKHEFSVEDCFGEIWQETFEKIRLTDREEAEVYAQLLEWAKRLKA
jgi:hypothetical protein